MKSRCCRISLQVLRFPPTVLKYACEIKCELDIVYRCECDCECECLCVPCNELAPCPGCHPAFHQWQWGSTRPPNPSVEEEAAIEDEWRLEVLVLAVMIMTQVKLIVKCVYERCCISENIWADKKRDCVELCSGHIYIDANSCLVPVSTCWVLIEWTAALTAAPSNKVTNWFIFILS